MTASTKYRVLLVVSGMSPQIITETLYGLFIEENWIPNEIHLITTIQGRDNAVLQLLEQQQTGLGYFHRFLNDYNITQTIKFDESTIHVICKDEVPLHDLKTPADNEAAADCISETIRALTANDHTELHVSLAGGRKTMGFYAGYALSIYGRQWDSLSHVLVSEDYESLRDFFYPTPYSQVIYKNTKPLDTKKAEIWLAKIPFVKLRSFIPNHTLMAENTFSQIINIINNTTTHKSLLINIKTRTIRLGNIELALKPRELSLYYTFAKAAKNNKKTITVHKDEKENTEITSAYLKIFKQIKGNDSDIENSEKNLKRGMGRDYFDTIKSLLKNKITKTLGVEAAKPYLIQTGKRGQSEFFINIEPEHITFVGE
jgi:CRISPR-associated protein (TIGR02584 family)